MNGLPKGRGKEYKVYFLMLNVKKSCFWKGEARAEKIHSLRVLDFDRRGRKDMVSSTSLRTCTKITTMTRQTPSKQNFQGVNSIQTTTHEKYPRRKLHILRPSSRPNRHKSISLATSPMYYLEGQKEMHSFWNT
jgi:hypothetical protein